VSKCRPTIHTARALTGSPLQALEFAVHILKERQDRLFAQLPNRDRGTCLLVELAHQRQHLMRPSDCAELLRKLRDKQAEFRSLQSVLQQRAHDLRVKELKLQARDHLVKVDVNDASTSHARAPWHSLLPLSGSCAVIATQRIRC